jgi:hypothetical protein
MWNKKTVKPNVVVEWLTALFHTRDVPGSNLGLETGFTWFPAVSQENAGIEP